MDDGPSANGHGAFGTEHLVAVTPASPGPDADLLVAEGLSKRFGGVHALADVSLRVRAGEILALAGENGSGKSTLAKIVAGVLPADSGGVTFAGDRCAFSRPRDALDAGIALVAQELTAVPNMSIAENVLLTRMHRVTARVRRRDQARDARPLLQAVGLDVDPAMPFMALGPGDRELAEVAKALASRPRLLILDEATTRLPDPEGLFRLVERLCADGLAVVFITHRLREIRRLAHRAVVLRDGRVAGELARAELTDEALSSMMVGRELTGYFHKVEARPGRVVLRVDEVVSAAGRPPVTLELRAGEVVGLAGLVGSGRSELLEAVCGARSRRGGRVEVDGRTVPSGSVAGATRAGVGFVPEDRLRQGLVVTSSVRENVNLASLRPLSRIDKRAERARARDAVDRLRIRCASVDAEVGTLSGGNQQKVVIARCLSSDPRVLLLDEPTSGVDVGAREEIYRIIGDMVAQGMGVLLSSSDMVELLGLCDRVLVMHEGAVVGALARAEATEERIALLSAGGTGVPDVA